MLRKRIQLGLIHAAVAITLVPINSTLNRVLIEDIGVLALTVTLLFSPPYLFSFIQVGIGSFSDKYPLWGFRRTPYISFVYYKLKSPGICIKILLIHFITDRQPSGGPSLKGRG